MRIGNVELPNPICLAPMAGVTDLPFRLLCREFGAGLVYSEMVSAKGLLYESANTRALLEADPRERPSAVQIFGSDPQLMGEMARRIEEYPFDIIDINMGCPAPKIVKNGEGSALMKDPALIGAIVKAVSSAVKKPVTVKVRKSFHNVGVNAVEAAKIAEANGAAAVAVHGRTREQHYSGTADWDIIAAVKQAVSIPVIGNGDIFEPQDVKRMMDQTGCDAVMIARGAEGNPWLFRRALVYLESGEMLPEPSVAERIEVGLCHARMLMEKKVEFVAMCEMRRHLCKYIKGIKGASAARSSIIAAETYAAMEQILLALSFQE